VTAGKHRKPQKNGGNKKMSEAKKLPEISANALKIIAVTAMLLDHFAAICFGSYYSTPLWILHMAGRFAIPIFSYFLVEGFYRTRDVNRYMSRMLVFAAISYVPYVWFFAGYRADVLQTDWVCFNQLFSFFFGLMFLKALHGDEKLVERIITGIIAFVGIAFSAYGTFGLAIILVMDVLHHNKKYGVPAYLAVVLTYAYENVFKSLANDFNIGKLHNYIMSPVFLPNMLVNFVGYCLPIILIAMPRKANEKRPGKFAKWFFYVFYPLHLLILLYIKYTFMVTGMPEGL
jgi:hypothetical protein